MPGPGLDTEDANMTIHRPSLEGSMTEGARRRNKCAVSVPGHERHDGGHRLSREGRLALSVVRTNYFFMSLIGIYSAYSV